MSRQHVKVWIQDSGQHGRTFQGGPCFVLFGCGDCWQDFRGGERLARWFERALTLPQAGFFLFSGVSQSYMPGAVFRLNQPRRCSVSQHKTA